MIDGVIFDLDGTLVDSRLDFDLMRREMGLPAGLPILETIAQLPPEAAQRCQQILHRHEADGAKRAVPLPGVLDFLAEITRRQLPSAILTRNSRAVAAAMLAKLPHCFDPVITRDEGPVKPNPWAIQAICRQWHVTPGQVVMIGDYWFDIAAGEAAGARTVLYGSSAQSETPHPAVVPGFHLPCFTQADELWTWLDEAKSL